MKTLIIAGTFKEAEYWAEEMKLPKKDWRYVLDADHIKGMHDVDIKFVGNWYRRPDAKELKAEAAWIERTRK